MVYQAPAFSLQQRAFGVQLSRFQDSAAGGYDPGQGSPVQNPRGPISCSRIPVQHDNPGSQKFERPLLACAVTRRRFPVDASPTRQPLQPEAIGAVMEVTNWLKPSISVSRIGDSASVQAASLEKRSMLPSKAACYSKSHSQVRSAFWWHGSLASKTLRCGSEREVAPHP
jgi:hypothetical protein